MCKPEIKDEHLNQRPVLFVIVVLNKIDLELFDLLHAVRKLEHHNEIKTVYYV